MLTKISIIYQHANRNSDSIDSNYQNGLMTRNISARSHFYKFVSLFLSYVVFFSQALTINSFNTVTCLSHTMSKLPQNPYTNLLPYQLQQLLSAHQDPKINSPMEQNIHSSLTTEITIHSPQVSKPCHFEEAIFGLLGINQ